MPSPCDPLTMLRTAAAAREEAGLARTLRVRPAGRGALTDLASNDYLGLCHDPRVTREAAAAARQWGAGATGSRLVTGSTGLHAALEEDLAAFTGAQQALVFSSGYLANLAVVTALASALAAGCGREPPVNLPRPNRDGSRPGPRAGAPAALVVSDAANHASLVDACRLARARVEVVPHRDVAAVERALASRPEPAALVVTESAFSVGGALAPLSDLHRAARRHGALLVVDEAHAVGVVGEAGQGAAWEAGLAGEPDVVLTLTLSKALGAQGGAVLGASEVIGTLVSTGRSFIFDTGLAPASAAAARCALRVLRQAPDLPSRARANTERLAAAAGRLGLPVLWPQGAVVTVTLGHPALAVESQRICEDNGAQVGCFRPPSVPPGRSCLRLTGRATLTERDFAVAGRALTAVRDLVRATSPPGEN